MEVSVLSLYIVVYFSSCYFK